MRLNNLEGLKIEYGQSSEVWEKWNKSLTFTRYLQESSNLQLSLLQSSPGELGRHPSCLLRLPTQFSLTARVQRIAQQGCLSHACLCHHRAGGSGFPWLPATMLFPFHPWGHVFAKAFSSDAGAVLPTMTFPVSTFSWEERQQSPPHLPSPGNFILYKAKYAILYNSWLAFPMPSPPVTSWKCLSRLLACSQLTFPAQVICLLRISSLFKSTSFQLKLRPFLFWWTFCILAGALTRAVPQAAFSYSYRAHGSLAQAMNWETPNLDFLIKKQYLLR